MGVPSEGLSLTGKESTPLMSASFSKRLGYGRRARFLVSTILGAFILCLQVQQLKPNLFRPRKPPPLPLEPAPPFRSMLRTDGPVGKREQKLRRLYGLGMDHGRQWLDHILDLDDEGLAPATKFAQNYLYHWQNPPLEDCSSRKFLVMQMGTRIDRGHGLGSMIHMTSYPLRNAIESGRILMWGDDDHTDVAPNFLKGAFGRIFVADECEVDGVRSLDCVFEPLSHCPRSSMTPENTVYGTVTIPPKEHPELGKAGQHWLMPTVFKNELERVLPYNMTGSAMKYWWRGQSAAYLMRLNRASLEYVADLRMDGFFHSAFTVDEDKTVLPLRVPFPLYRGTFSMHIRHGDKAQEMGLHSLQKYLELGEKISSLNPNAYAKMAFLSSEDPAVFQQAREIRNFKGWGTTPNMNWQWYHSHIGRINGSPFSQLDAFGNRTETTLSWMSEAFLALECSAFVGTRGSNWNRVIDELRCIWMDSCRAPYLEVGEEKDWLNYSW